MDLLCYPIQKVAMIDVCLDGCITVLETANLCAKVTARRDV